MLFMTRYSVHANADRSPDHVKALLAKFAELGGLDGEIAHYAAADGSGGFIISENDSMLEAHERILQYNQWFSFELTPVLPVEEAVGVAMKVYG